jgi:2-polyprenyl-6-hydroxyphenyl methylase/3-demethylubiquinone-9 3-methyltransferase
MIDSQTEISTGERFAFGANWRRFIELVDEARIQAAVDSLTASLGVSDLTDRDFLDIGCGSGLFSLAAHRLGARVRSFDFDPESVAATSELRRRFAPDSDWIIEVGSVLDESFLAGLGDFDIVYSWGVLHHTGDMWRAVDTAAGRVRADGTLFISIYNDQGWESRMWRSVKHRYNRGGKLTRAALIAGSTAYLGRRWPAKKLAGLLGVAPKPAHRARGMSRKHDLVDWVGGYPFEVAKPEEIFHFLHGKGFELSNLTTCAGGIGCNEYVLRRVS